MSIMVQCAICDIEYDAEDESEPPHDKFKHEVLNRLQKLERPARKKRVADIGKIRQLVELVLDTAEAKSHMSDDDIAWKLVGPLKRAGLLP